jgi:hypothetical protein
MMTGEQPQMGSIAAIAQMYLRADELETAGELQRASDLSHAATLLMSLQQEAVLRDKHFAGATLRCHTCFARSTAAGRIVSAC